MWKDHANIEAKCSRAMQGKARQSLLKRNFDATRSMGFESIMVVYDTNAWMFN